VVETLPENLTAYKKTPEFTESTIPKGLTRAHHTKQGTWALINVQEGKLLYRILEPEMEEVLLSKSLQGVIAPTVKHEVEAQGKVKFLVEFYR